MLVGGQGERRESGRRVDGGRSRRFQKHKLSFEERKLMIDQEHKTMLCDISILEQEL